MITSTDSVQFCVLQLILIDQIRFSIFDYRYITKCTTSTMLKLSHIIYNLRNGHYYRF